MSLYSLIGKTKGQRQEEADYSWLDDFTVRNIAASEARVDGLAVEYDAAVAVWSQDKLCRDKYSDVVRLEHELQMSGELNLMNHAERFNLNAIR